LTAKVTKDPKRAQADASLRQSGQTFSNSSHEAPRGRTTGEGRRE